MNTKLEFGSWPLDEVDYDEIQQAIQDLVRKGLTRYGQRVGDIRKLCREGIPGKAA